MIDHVDCLLWLELVVARIVCYYRFVMEKTVRITRLEEQDETRRADARKITPAGRMETLMKMRDHLYPYAPLERVVTIRALD